MTARKRLPPAVEVLAKQFFTGLLNVGNRAIAAAAKSATKDGQRFVGGIKKKLDDLEDGLSAFDVEDAQQDDEVRVEVVGTPAKKRRTKRKG